MAFFDGLLLLIIGLDLSGVYFTPWWAYLLIVVGAAAEALSKKSRNGSNIVVTD